MIVQGNNKPIQVTLDAVPLAISITLSNEIEIIRHWAKDDMIVSEDGLTYTAPIDQAESLEWPEGPCKIEIRWMDSIGKIHKMVIRELIEWTADRTILEEEGA